MNTKIIYIMIGVIVSLIIAALSWYVPLVHTSPVILFTAGALSGGLLGVVVSIGYLLLSNRSSGAQNTKQAFIEAHSTKNDQEQSQRLVLIGSITAGIAHDFNNLLTAMLGHIDALIEQFTPASPGFAELIQIKKSGLKAAHMIKKLLSFSRQETVKPVVFDLLEQIKESLNFLTRLSGNMVEIVIEVPKEYWIRLDPGQLEQILLNLVVNARDAMPKGGKVTISAEKIQHTRHWKCNDQKMPPGEYTTLMLTDTGTGIDPQIMPNIFDPYFTTKAVGKGTGLGLASTFGIMHQAQGTIDVRNMPEGGAQFRLYFLTEQEPEEILQPLTPTTHNNLMPLEDRSKVLILVVEDMSAVRFVIVQQLKRAGYRVIESSSGNEALERLQEKDLRPDLIITDIVMPGIDGPSLIKSVREFQPNVKVIFVSGYADIENRDHIAKDTRAEFLPKPFTSKELLNLVINKLQEN